MQPIDYSIMLLPQWAIGKATLPKGYVGIVPYQAIWCGCLPWLEVQRNGITGFGRGTGSVTVRYVLK